MTNNDSSNDPDRQDDGAALLDDVVAFLRRFVSFTSPSQADILALWIAHTHAIEAAYSTPYLYITSVEPGSGKTRTSEVAELLVRAPLPAAHISAPALFQSLAAEPTLILDEVDALWTRRGGDTTEALRAVLNAGYRRGRPVRRGTKQGQPVSYETFCPKALIGIDNRALPQTIRDRCIRLELRRRRPDEEPLDPFIARFITPEADALKERIATWITGVLDDLHVARPALPEELDDRAQEISDPLLAIADVAGGAWPERGRSAVRGLLGNRTEAVASHGILLLRDIRDMFDAEAADRMPSTRLVEQLNGLEVAPWGTWRRAGSADGLNPRQLALMLGDYGIEPKSVRMPEGTTPKGYYRADFEDAWARYLPPSATAATAATAARGDGADAVDAGAEDPQLRQLREVVARDVKRRETARQMKQFKRKQLPTTTGR